jgi:hypothetical protein
VTTTAHACTPPAAHTDPATDTDPIAHTDPAAHAATDFGTSSRGRGSR